MVLAVTWFALGDLPEFFRENSNSESWARFLVTYAGSAYILISLSNSAGHLLEEAIDTYPTLSYLKLNKGDAKVIEEFEGRRKGSIIKFIISAIFSIVLGIISSKLEKLL